MPADGNAGAGSGGTHQPEVRLRGFGPKKPPDAPPSDAAQPSQSQGETPPASPAAPGAPPTEHASSPAPNYGAVRLKGFEAKRDPAPAPPPVTSTGESASADVAQPAASESRQPVEVPRAPAPPPATNFDVVRLHGFAPKTQAAPPATYHDVTVSAPTGSAPADGSSPNAAEPPSAPPQDFAPAGRASPSQPSATLNDAARPASFSLSPAASPATDTERSTPVFQPSPGANAGPAETKLTNNVPKRYRPDTDPERMARRRWWKDALYTKSGRRAEDAQKYGVGQVQA